MLKRKLAQNLESIESVSNEKQEKRNIDVNASPLVSMFFENPIWKEFYDLECQLNKEISLLKPSPPIQFTYNPIEYASELHCAYLQKYLNGPKKLIFIGMNPGPNGMGQTGIPFGNIATVRDTMKITGTVQQPPSIHPKRPVNGLLCKIEEPSGVRIWTLLQRLAGGSLSTLFQQCFVHNFCPLAFFDSASKNITPSELKGDYKNKIRDVCLNTTYKQLELINPLVIVAVGDYVYNCFKKYDKAKVLKMPHPSPRALNNTNWPEKAEQWLIEQDLIKYIQNTSTN